MRPRGRARLRVCRAASEGDPVSKKAKTAEDAAANKAAAPSAPPPVRLLSKAEVLAMVGVSFPTVWGWMRAGTFPRSRVVGAKSKWLSTDIESWIAGLPRRPLKGDQPDQRKVEEVA
jgi:predicted DNA-binding transcriptional regulator AlpA